MRDRLRKIELSRFWSIRNRFFALKHRLGFTSDSAWETFEIPPTYRAILERRDPYAEWRVRHDPREADLDFMRRVGGLLAYRASFDIDVTGERSGPEYEATLASLRAQVYDDWRLAEHSRYESDFVVFVASGDRLAPHALFAFAVEATRGDDVDLVYGDDDSIDALGRRQAPHFKPDWSPETLLSRNYIGDFFACRRLLVERVGGMRAEFAPASAFDLLLRASELARTIVHVALVVLHRTLRPDSDPAYGDAAREVIAATLDRRAEHGSIQATGARTFVVRYTIASDARVSVLIPSRDHAEDLERCLSSIVARTTFRNFEILLIDNGTREPEAVAVIARWAKAEPRIRVLKMDVPFNYSRLNNSAARVATGDYLCLLNNDTEIVTPDWLEALVEQAQRPAIGAVGAYLVYPDGWVQHGGVVLGIGGVAGHSHRNSPPGDGGYFNALRTVTNYSAVTAACLLVRKAVYEEVGGLDETLTVAFNDIDFCLRIGRAGYRNVWLPHVVVAHGESRSRGHDVGLGKTHRSLVEQRVMLERWAREIANDPYYSPHLTRLDESYAIRIDV